MSCILKDMIERYVNDRIPQLQAEIKEVTTKLTETTIELRTAKSQIDLLNHHQKINTKERDEIAKGSKWLKISISFSILGNIALIIVSLYLYFC